MKKIIVFSGTTEGRMLSEALSAKGVSHHVCVASEYGREVMKENAFAEIHVGRMNTDEMKKFASEIGMNEGDIVIDATHPYAVLVSENVRQVACECGFQYIRVLRKDNDVNKSGFYYDNMAECIAALEATEGNILLTTGSKDLKCFAGCDEAFKSRVYVRVLPAIDSLMLCEEAGIESSHIIAMHGPFSYEMNAAQLKQFDIRHMVTKASGSAGGFEEKINAAEDCGVISHILARPADGDGFEWQEAFEAVVAETRVSNTIPECGKPVIKEIILAGIGMGAKSGMTEEVKAAIKAADAVFGSGRMIAGISGRDVYDMYLAEDIIPVIENHSYKKCVVLFSGDSGFYSGAANMADKMRHWAESTEVDAVVTVLPGISSVSYLAAKIGIKYDDAFIFSIHGRNSAENLNKLIWNVRYNVKSFVLMSGDEDVRTVASLLQEENIDATIYVGNNLSYENEQVLRLSVEEATGFYADGVSTVCILGNAPKRRALIPVMSDADFERDKVPMTKEIVRHESVRRLGLRENDVVLDVGGGTGSVAIEIAKVHPSLKVYTIEKNPEAVELIQKNVLKHHVRNLTVIAGEAAQEIKKVESPDAVFIGGSCGCMGEIFDELKSRGKDMRVVVTAVSLETMGQINEMAQKYAFSNMDCVQIAVTEVKNVGEHHLLRANNPIMIYSFVLNA